MLLKILDGVAVLMILVSFGMFAVFAFTGNMTVNI